MISSHTTIKKFENLKLFYLFYLYDCIVYLQNYLIVSQIAIIIAYYFIFWQALCYLTIFADCLLKAFFKLPQEVIFIYLHYAEFLNLSWPYV